MKRIFRKLGEWLVRKVVAIYNFLEKVIVHTPRKIRAAIFSVAHWGKLRLDRHIDSRERKYLQSVIFETKTEKGRQFDRILTWFIILSILVVIFQTVSTFQKAFWWIFFILEWIFTILFTIEYILRLYSSKNPLRYATSFFGIVDLLSIIPTYLTFFFIEAQGLTIIRALRLMRIFRIFKMGHFVREGEVILNALRASRVKITIFVTFLLAMSMVIGAVLYIVEGHVNPALNNIPKGIYWAIVTLTTVGYGDVTPITPFGKILATIVMVMGYGIIAVPTGIVTAEISGRVMNLKEVEQRDCDNCGQSEHHTNSTYCHSCGEKLS